CGRASQLPGCATADISIEKLLYGSAEGLTFTASVDDEGARMNAGCRYRISGQTPPARIWTLFTADNGGNPAAVKTGHTSALNSWTVL
ncbi:DUF1214 domain-containing protein, partial [Rhizobium ruizarguesonis]